MTKDAGPLAKNWRKVINGLVAARQYFIDACDFILGLLVEAVGANLEPSQKNNQNAVGTLQFLATFALTQGGALALASQFTKNTAPLLAVYLVLAAFTVAGVILLMRLSEYDPAAAPGSAARHYFDYPTIAFARWTLGCTVMLPVIFLVLVFFGFQPLVRQTYPSGNVIRCDQAVSAENAKAITFAGRVLGDDKKSQEILLDWLSKGATRKGGAGSKPQTLLVVKQAEPFATDYYSFAAQIDFGKASDLQPVHDDVLAFLVHDEAEGAGRESVMRTITFRMDKDGNYTRVFDALSPNKGERLVFLIVRENQESLNEVTIKVR